MCCVQELLGLAHLRKVYSEHSSPSHPLSATGGPLPPHHPPAEREAKLYSMLPLFCKIFNSVPPSVITEKFPEATSFTQVLHLHLHLHLLLHLHLHLNLHLHLARWGRPWPPDLLPVTGIANCLAFIWRGMN